MLNILSLSLAMTKWILYNYVYPIKLSIYPIILEVMRIL